VLVFAAAGGAAGLIIGYGWFGAVIAFVISGILAFASYWKSDAVALAVSRARPADPETYKRLHNLVEGLCIAAGLPKPRLYVVDDPAPNAFATGRNPEHAAVAATTGIMRVLTDRELRGVMAHELAHVAHRDILISTISATMAGAIGMLANFAMFFGGRDSEGRPANPIAGIAVAFLAPIAAGLIQMAISRAREFEADRGGAELSGDPQGLASALQKIQAYARGTVMPTAERNPATAQMMRSRASMSVFRWWQSIHLHRRNTPSSSTRPLLAPGRACK
jgi:heat shock protein HtpX